jgi:predicted dehydrogenase
MRVSIVGYGAVSEIHAQQLRSRGDVQLTAICGPSFEKAAAFAEVHGFERAVTRLEDALDSCDALIVTSPSPCHFEQGKAALQRGVPVLIELPACSSVQEAENLGSLSGESGAVVQCAHTSRYLTPYLRLGWWIEEGRLGVIRQIHYFRCIPPRVRNWTDDAMRHHAAHPLDLFLHWFGEVKPAGFARFPEDSAPQDVVLVGHAGETILTIAVSYTARIPEVRMTVIGDRHTVATDGFSYIESDCAEISWQGDGQEVYERAIRDQDRAFLNCCRAGTGGIPWSETSRLITSIEGFRN